MGLACQVTLSAPKIPRRRMIYLNMARVDFLGGVHARLESVFSLLSSIRRTIQSAFPDKCLIRYPVGIYVRSQKASFDHHVTI